MHPFQFAGGAVGLVLLLGLVSGASAGAIGYDVSYVINMDPPSSNGSDIQGTVIFEWDSSGKVKADLAGIILGSGVTTLTHTIDFEPTAALIIGYGLADATVGDEKDHLYTVTNTSFADSTLGMKWSRAFPGDSPESRVGHNAMIQLLKGATTDTPTPGALDALLDFVATEGFQAAFDPAGDFTVVEWTCNGGVCIPTPTTLALFGLGLAGIGYQRRKQLITA